MSIGKKAIAIVLLLFTLLTLIDMVDILEATIDGNATKVNEESQELQENTIKSLPAQILILVVLVIVFSFLERLGL